jgi:hypothetical protein
MGRMRTEDEETTEAEVEPGDADDADDAADAGDAGDAAGESGELDAVWDDHDTGHRAEPSSGRDLPWARAQLGVALVLMAVRFVDLADPTRLAWLVGFGAASAGTALVLAAAVEPGPRRWWRPAAVVGAITFQAGLVVGWNEPMDVTAAGPSLPVLLCGAGALVVALALGLLSLQAPAGDVDRTRWPLAAAIGAAAGYGLTLVGGARLLAFDVAEHVSAGATIDEWLVDLAPLAIVTVLATPLALGAVAVVQSGLRAGEHQPGRSAAALVGLAAVPLAAAGDGLTALVLGGTAILAGVVAARRRPVALVAVPSIVLGGTALAAQSGAWVAVLGVLAVAAYGALLGLLAIRLAEGGTDRDDSAAGGHRDRSLGWGGWTLEVRRKPG